MCDVEPNRIEFFQNDKPQFKKVFQELFRTQQEHKLCVGWNMNLYLNIKIGHIHVKGEFIVIKPGIGWTGG